MYNTNNDDIGLSPNKPDPQNSNTKATGRIDDNGNNVSAKRIDIMSLQLTESLRQEEIVTRYEYNLKTQHLTLELNLKYDNKIVSSHRQTSNVCD